MSTNLRFKIAYDHCMSLVDKLTLENNGKNGHFNHILRNIAGYLLPISKGQIKIDIEDGNLLKDRVMAIRKYKKLLRNEEFRKAELNEGYFNTKERMPLDENGNPMRIFDSVKYILYSSRHFYTDDLID